MPLNQKSRVIPNPKNSMAARAEAADRPHAAVGSNYLFPAPTLNSSVRPQVEIIRITEDILGAIDELELTPQNQAALAPKVTQKMNFLPHQAVFKGLVSLNVNDSILPPKKIARKPSKGQHSKENRAKTVEPELEDYVQPIAPKQLNIPEPELHLEFKPEPFNFLEAYKKLFK
ncbi:uncharacterized protein LOC108162198 [Drosophila miranda]|uniref:uncharacterized protein LOC108162198 n=1 Tax=Drosophila miranda TaxID=7229 RepID=UPI0007E71990|nr:uncharacterized protein LOC108162198 [Drosophila miranda]XP_017152295.1 uncharacterized protein LOC108162198 [Drosophila miranda]XP_017152297.1 uncharacterized protein LOC108162198 [Drosophila miranda]